MPVYGGITVDLKRLDKVIKIDEISQTVTAQAGINGYRLEQALNQQGFTLPHYAALRSLSYPGRLSGSAWIRGAIH